MKKFTIWLLKALTKMTLLIMIRLMNRKSSVLTDEIITEEHGMDDVDTANDVLCRTDHQVNDKDYVCYCHVQ